MAKLHVGSLSKPFRDAYRVLEKVQVGVAGGEEAWRECVVATDITIGPALGAMYIKETFNNASLAEVRIYLKFLLTLLCFDLYCINDTE